MKFTTLTTATLLTLTCLSTSQPLPNDVTNKVPIRWNDVEAGIHAAQSSASASAPMSLTAREAVPEPEPRKSKSGAEVSGWRGGSGLWGRSRGPAKKEKPEKKIEEVNVFDEGVDHKSDPSWG